ncbi:MAG: hypothetical protein EOO08_03400 [Chitinophagaceae bacterium]|nr:MAG: hypothetical protein EOO08_03400 [Chitinophagaceae bacterium]
MFRPFAYSFFISLGVLLAASAGAQDPSRPQLRARIDSLWQSALRPPPSDSVQWVAVLPAERARNNKVRSILEGEGYPGTREVGAEGVEHFWLLLQKADADPPLQRLALGLMRPQVVAGNVPGRHLAWLQDRVLVNSGQLQWYGTQIRLNADSSSFEPRPVEDPPNLDLRRSTLGLEPIAEYIALMNRRYGELLRPKE